MYLHYKFTQGNGEFYSVECLISRIERKDGSPIIPPNLQAKCSRLYFCIQDNHLTQHSPETFPLQLQGVVNITEDLIMAVTAPVDHCCSHVDEWE